MRFQLESSDRVFVFSVLMPTAARKFVVLIACINLPVLLLVGALNYLVDGSSSHHLPNSGGVFPRTTGHSALSKLYYLSIEHPEVVFFGSSRVEVGLPTDPILVGGGSVYNAGLSASSFADFSALAIHTLHITKPKVIVMGIDFPSFKTKQGTSGLDHSLLSMSRYNYFANRIPFDIRQSLSLSATRETIHSVHSLIAKEKYDEGVTPISVAGQMTEEYMENLILSRGKAAIAFQKKIELAFLPPPSEIETDGAMKLLDNTISTACGEKVVIRIFINPIHALAEHAVFEYGAWDRLEKWKIDLAAIATKYQTNCDVRIVDFSGYNSITSETITGLSPTKRLNNYWEASHYKSAVGKLILKRLFMPGSGAIPTDFGRDLSTDSVQNVLQSIRQEQAQFMRNHADEISLARTWIKADRHPGSH